MAEKKVSDVFGHPGDPRSSLPSEILIDSGTSVGIELEVEGMNRYDPSLLTSSRLWVITDDGSLRNHGLEFIMGVPGRDPGQIEPLRGGDIDRALKLFEDSLKNFKAKPELTERTSMHVHVDVRDLDMSQLINYILLFTIFEETFFKFSDYERYSNNYCKPVGCTTMAQETIAKIVQVVKDKRSTGSLYEAFNNASKYEAMNIASIRNRGSIEFRLYKGSVDVNEITNWINMLLSLKMLAMENVYTIWNLPEKVSEYGFMPFLMDAFPNTHQLLTPHISESDILRGVRIAQDILNMENYSKVDKQFNGAYLGKKAKDDSIMHHFAEAMDRKLSIETE